MLAVLGAPQLAATLLPVGEMTKADVRAHAARLGLRTATKAESMDVCFITRGGRTAFLDARVPAGARARSSTPPVPSSATHDGVRAFTVGQRRGLAVATGERRYVVDVDAATATVTLGRAEDLARDARRGHRRRRSPARRSRPGRASRCRSAPTAWPGRGTWRGRPRGCGTTPQPRVAPGQTVALYDGDRVLGAGIAA